MDNKPFMGLFNTGTPTGYFASQQDKPSLAWGAAATGDPMLTYALTKNPILAMMAGQQGNILPKEPVKVAPATGIIAGNASPSLGFALTGDSNFLMMDKLIDPANMDLALANAYNHPTPSQQDLFYGSLASDPKVAYALTGNPIIANMASRARAGRTAALRHARRPRVAPRARPALLARRDQAQGHGLAAAAQLRGEPAQHHPVDARQPRVARPGALHQHARRRRCGKRGDA